LGKKYALLAHKKDGFAPPLDLCAFLLGLFS